MEDKASEEEELDDLVEQGIVEVKIRNGERFYRLTERGISVAKELKKRERVQ
jgi:predicted transcriptional regulator with HTH domain